MLCLHAASWRLIKSFKANALGTLGCRMLIRSPGAADNWHYVYDRSTAAHLKRAVGQICVERASARANALAPWPIWLAHFFFLLPRRFLWLLNLKASAAANQIAAPKQTTRGSKRQTAAANVATIWVREICAPRHT